MAIYRESSLADSKLYQDLKSLSGQNPSEKARELIKKAMEGSPSVKELTKEDIEASYVQLKQYSNSLYRASVKGWDNGIVKLIYNSDAINSINKAIPFLTFNHKTKGFVAYAFVDSYVSINRRDGYLNFPPDRLRDILIGCVISVALKKDYSRLTSNSYLENILMELYTKYVCRIFAKQYSLPSNKELYDKVQYWVNKFFLLNVFNSTSSRDSIENLAKKDIRYLDEMVIKEIEEAYDNKEVDIQSFEGLLDFIRFSHPLFNNLGISSFLNSWINYYYAPALLALENIEYLIFMTVALMHGNFAFINSYAQPMVTETKNIRSLNEELLKLVQ